MRSSPQRAGRALSMLLFTALALHTAACQDPCGQLLSSDPSQTRYMEALDGVAKLVGAPGAMVTILAPGQETPWIGVSGCMDLDALTPMTLDASMRMASVSKPLNAMIFMALVEQGQVSLDDPITLDAPGDAQTPTARDLLQMTSGVADYLDEPFWRSFEQDPLRVRTPQELIALGMERPSTGLPGQRWSYSNTNHLLLEAHLLARTSRSLQAHLQTLHAGQAPSLVYTHLTPALPPLAGSAAQDCLRPMCRVVGLEGTFHPSIFGAAGSLAGKPAELASLTRALLHDGGLSPQSLQEMTQWRVVQDDDHRQIGQEYGLGLYKLNTPKGLWWGHPGLGLGDSALLAYSPESGAVVVVTASRALGQSLTDHVLQDVLPKVTP